MTSFLAFAKLCQKVEAVSGSLEKIDLVAAFLAGLDEAELSVACSFIMGTLFSPSLDLVLGVGPSILYEALAKACGCPAEQISEMLRATGDPGLVAAGIVEKRRPLGFAAFLKAEPLSFADVYERFVAIARASGKRSQDIKVKNLQFLFSQAGSLEARYIARLAIEDMRIGIGEGGVRDAVARAFAGSGADAEMVERAYNLTNDMGLVAVAARRGTLSQLSVMINHPIKMMLAQLGESIPAALADIGTAAIEWKYDGARVQIHKEGESIRIFSRRLENVTASLPEIVVGRQADNRKERHTGWRSSGHRQRRPAHGLPGNFETVSQEIQCRKACRPDSFAPFPVRFDLSGWQKRASICPFIERRALLEKIANSTLLADQVLSGSVEAAEEIYRQALAAGHEGLILKNPFSVYAPGKRGKNWLKIKPVMETLDLVVIGAKWGEGRRASFLGSYRLGCRDTATGNLLDVGFVATGLTDEALAELTEMFRELILLEKGMEVEIKPAVIFEVAYEEIQKSPNYSSGYALRFPRLVAVRDDKSLEEADSLERVVSLYKGQRGRSNSV